MCTGRFFQALRYHHGRRSQILQSTWCLRLGTWRNSASCPYKAVIFDMGGVLLPSPYTLAAEWEVRNGVPPSTIRQALVSGGENRPWLRYMRGELMPAEFLHGFGQQCAKIANTSIPVDSFLSDFTSGQMARQLPVMTEAIKRIRAKGLKTAVLSNNFYLPSGESFLPLDRRQFDVVEDPEAAVRELETHLGFPLQQRSVPYTCPVRPAMEVPRDSLQQYLENIWGAQGEGPLQLRQFSHGQSNPTYYVQFGDRRLVLRKKPPGKLLPSAHAVEREYRVLKALAKAGTPVPQVHAMCEDSSVIGTPFYLMDYCTGRIFKDPSLPDLEPSQRREIYFAMNGVLCKIHSVDIKVAGLEDYGKHGNYIQRQVQIWSKQYRSTETHPIPAMERLLEWLPSHLPASERLSVVHGDFRLDNLIFHPEHPEVIAVLDWELSTLGDPLSDVAYNCLAYYLPSDFSILKGLSDCDLSRLGIPTAEAYFQAYCDRLGVPPARNWNFYMAFSFFRAAAIFQGVYKRSLTGQASSATAERVGKQAEFMADIAWDFATKEGFRIFNQRPAPGAPSRRFGTWARPGPFPRRSYAAGSGPASTDSTKHRLVVSPEGLPGRVRELHRKLRRFMEAHIYPAEQALRDHQASQGRWTPHPLTEELKASALPGESLASASPLLGAKAKSEGLWNLFLPLESDPEVQYGAGLTNLEYAHLCELMGTSVYAPEVFNCSAPDTGNMEVLLRYGTGPQKERWLRPLLDGEIRSCFAMTEPQVASSDATNIEASITTENGVYVLNGRKWWISGSLDPRCQLCIFMGKTDPAAPGHKQQSMLLVPMSTPGVTVTRPLTVYGLDDAPAGHGEMVFEDVRVPQENILLGPGRGFEIAQGRLGPGRIHHCMRLVGFAERALALMKERNWVWILMDMNRTGLFRVGLACLVQSDGWDPVTGEARGSAHDQRGGEAAASKAEPSPQLCRLQVNSRVAFGKPLAEQGTIRADIAKSRVEIEQARLLVLKAAHLMDTVGNKEAALEIAMIKVVAPSMALQVVDRAIQAFGAAGLSNDLPLAQFFAWARALRLADGPDEVHRAAIAKLELKR
ncbi:hypothetical protein lerEdw1_003579 [Lerista edwardsae]|nr:hypothetical protein lerEdw1_003579 [Lerista edwardsae]